MEALKRCSTGNRPLPEEGAESSTSRARGRKLTSLFCGGGRKKVAKW